MIKYLLRQTLTYAKRDLGVTVPDQFRLNHKRSMTTTLLRTIAAFLDDELQVNAFNDLAYNGLQIESSALAVSKIAFAVDAGLSIARRAVEANCQLLVVHHGILWGRSEPYVGPLAKKLHHFLSNGLSLYAAHLPLDGHPVHGNAAQLAKSIGANEVFPCFHYKGSPIGARAQFANPMRLDDIIAQLSTAEGALCPPLVLPFGKRMISSIGVATGSATSVIPECTQLGLDLLITGEAKQEAYHMAREHECSVVCMGHYASETFGVKALKRVLAERFRVETIWIDEPTGI